MFVRSLKSKDFLRPSTTIGLGLLFLFSCSQDMKRERKAGNTASTSADSSTGNLESLDGGTEQSLDDIIKACGIASKDLNNPDKIVLKKQLRSMPKVVTGTKQIVVLNIAYRVEIVTKVNVVSKIGGTTQTTDFDITATPAQAKGEADDAVAPMRGTSRTTNFTMDERQKLMSDHEEWAGIVCTVQPASEMTITRDGKTKTIRFKPALPYTLSPKADAARYKAEIGDGKVFNDIEAEIISSSDAGYPEGRKITGRVTISPASASQTVDYGGEATAQVSGDAAYKLEFDFGNANNALGLEKSQTFFLNHSQRDLKYTVVESSFSEAGTLVLTGN